MDQARLEQIKQRVEAVQDKFRSQDERDLLDLLAAIAEAQATIQRQAAELAEARKDAAMEHDEKIMVMEQCKAHSYDQAKAFTDKQFQFESKIALLQAEIKRNQEDLHEARDRFHRMATLQRLTEDNQYRWVERHKEATEELSRLRADAKRLAPVAEQIKQIAATYREQMDKQGYVGTPGGIEHVGDAFTLILKWEAAMAAQEGA